jgi:hypothetical protein
MDLRNSAVNRHKTKLLGIIMIVLGFLQTDTALKGLVPENLYALLVSLAGLGTLICGFLNSFESTQPDAPVNKQAGSVRLAMLFTLVVTTFTLISMGCTGMQAAYKQADTIDEQAYVVAEHYASLVKEAADLKEKPSTPRAVVTRMREADLAAAPVVNRVRDLRKSYLTIRDAKTELELQEAVNEAILLVADLVRAVKQARGEST